MSRKGESYIGGHSIVHGTGKLGFERPSFGRVLIAESLWSKGFNQGYVSNNKRDLAKWRSWAARRAEIGTGSKTWSLIRSDLEVRLRKLSKSGVRDPRAAARLWNASNFRTYGGGVWNGSLVLTASKAVGLDFIWRPHRNTSHHGPKETLNLTRKPRRAKKKS